MFCNTILLWSMSNCAVSHNTFILAKLIKLFPIECHAIVNSQALDLFSSLFLDHDFPFLELPKDIILMFQDIYPDLSKVILNKGQHISSTTMWYNLRRAPKIQMDIISSPTFCPSNKPRLLRIVNLLLLIWPSHICHNLVVSIIDCEVEIVVALVTMLSCNV